MPAGNKAHVDPAKIAGYLLDPDHRVGRHMARVFETVLGLTRLDAGRLEDALKAAAANEEALLEGDDVFGARYVIEFLMDHRGGQRRSGPSG